ncbi:MAG: hypothetical protein EB007_04240 [Betaproteobacteria bacterium]|nr:hypothetical protein [Betaproteobacteria bacterium]
MQTTLTRRAGLRLLSAAGAFLPLRMVFAAPASTREDAGPRLVVVMLRGALDGLAAVPAQGDPAWAALRTNEDAAAAALPLDATFSMHPALSNLHRWYTRKELLVVHATASPYRERSHFDAQQLLESGGERPFVLSTGWLGRALQASDKRAIAITAAMPLALRGADGASTWTPDRRRPVDQDLMSRVAQMYRGDAQLSAAFGEAAVQEDMAMGADGGPGFAGQARQAGAFLADPKGPRVGTGGVAFIAGGHVAGGTVLTDWPGLAGGQLFEGRDLKPTIDLRSVMVPIVQRQFGLDPSQIQSNILPGAVATRHALWRA